MPILPRLTSLWRNLTRRAAVDRDLDDELASYLRLLTEEKMRAGLSPEAARRAALVESGGVEFVKAEVRAVRAGARLEALLLDVRYTLRGLRRSPAFTAVAVATIALGIGANTAIFSLVDAVLLQPLPFREPDRLIAVAERADNGNVQRTVSGHEFAAWRDGNTTLEGIALWNYSGFNLTGDGEPEAVSGYRVSANYFGVLGVTPLAGRGFVSGEDQPGATPVVVLSERLWTRRYAADSAILGRTILLDDRAHQVVGVMPALGGLEPALWVPMDVPAEEQRVGAHISFAIARLARGVTPAQALADLETISARLARDLPRFNTGHVATITPLADTIVGSVRRPMWIALGAVAFVLLLACVNVAHLQLTRAVARQRELALRGALGAGRGRLTRQLLTESLVMSMLGGALGVLGAVLLVRALPALVTVDIPRLETARVDGRVLIVAFMLVLLTAALSGLGPAIRGSRPLHSTLISGTRSSVGVSGRLAGAFVVSEVALALVLLVGAGLMVRSFLRVTSIDPGFDPDGTLAIELALPSSRYPDARAQRRAYDALLARLGALPGVRSIAATSAMPLAACCSNYPILIEGRPEPQPGEQRSVPLKVVTAHWWRTMGIPVRAGRTFTEADARVAVPVIRYYEQQPYPSGFDQPQPVPVAVISESMAREFWPDEDPVGRRFRLLASPWITVIGVAGDVRHSGLDRAPMPDVYLPFSQEPNDHMTVVVRATGDPRVLGPAIRRELRAFDPDLPIIGMAAVADVLGSSVADRRFHTMLLGWFGAVALVLSLIGTYGVIAYGVTQRTQEIGIRAALGAGTREVLRLVLGRALGLAAIGIAIGAVAASLLTRVLEGLLYGVTPHDATTFITIPVLLLFVSLAASYLPTRRALRIDPVIALKE